MKAIIYPISLGLLATIVIGALLSIAFAFLISFFPDVMRPYVPVFIVIPTLLACGFVTSLKAKTKHVQTKLLISGVSGFISTLIALFAFSALAIQSWLFTILIFALGIVIAILGALMAQMVPNTT